MRREWGDRFTAVRSVFRDALTNRPLRRLELGYAMFFGAEMAVWLALLVYGYGHGGRSGASLMALVQLVPSALLAPLLGTVADRRRPGRVLFAGRSSWPSPVTPPSRPPPEQWPHATCAPRAGIPMPPPVDEVEGEQTVSGSLQRDAGSLALPASPFDAG